MKRKPVHPLRAFRALSGFTQFDLGQAAGISPNVISKIELRQRAAKWSELEKLAKVLAVRPETLKDDGARRHK